MLNHINIDEVAIYLATRDIGQFLSGYKRSLEGVTMVLLFI